MALFRWVFKQLYDKGLVYRGVKVMPFSTACNTPLSNFESHQNYKVGAEQRRCTKCHDLCNISPILSSRTFKIHPSLLTSHWWKTKTWPWLPGQPHLGRCPATWPSVSTQRCCMSRSKVGRKTLNFLYYGSWLWTLWGSSLWFLAV